MSIFSHSHISIRSDPEVQRLMDEAYAAKRRGDNATFTRLRKQALNREAFLWEQEHSQSLQGSKRP